MSRFHTSGALSSLPEDAPFGPSRARPRGIVKLLVYVELSIIGVLFGSLPVLAGLGIAWLGSTAATSAATQSAPTSTARVTNSWRTLGNCSNGCDRTTLVLEGLHGPRGDGTKLVIRNDVSGSGTLAGATIAVKQNPTDPRHIEVPGYPDSPRLREWTWSILAVMLGALGAAFDLMLIRYVALSGRFGYRVRIFTTRHLQRQPRPPMSMTTGRLVRHYLLPTLGIPIVICLGLVLGFLGAGATSKGNVTHIDPVGAVQPSAVSIFPPVRS